MPSRPPAHIQLAAIALALTGLSAILIRLGRWLATEQIHEVQP